MLLAGRGVELLEMPGVENMQEIKEKYTKEMRTEYAKWGIG